MSDMQLTDKEFIGDSERDKKCPKGFQFMGIIQGYGKIIVDSHDFSLLQVCKGRGDVILVHVHDDEFPFHGKTHRYVLDD